APGEWVELEAQLGVAGKLGSEAHLTIDGRVVATVAIGEDRQIRAMVRAPGPGLYQLGVSLDNKLHELIGHRVLQVAGERPVVLIDAAMLLPGPEDTPLISPYPMIQALLDAGLELAYFDIHDKNRSTAIHEALEAHRLPTAATLIYATEEHAVERLGVDFAHLFGMTALRKLRARGVPVTSIVSDRLGPRVDEIEVLHPEEALRRAMALEFVELHAQARHFVATREAADPIDWRLTQATGCQRLPGNHFHIELDNRAARTRLFELVENARSSIHIQVYMVRAGEFAEELIVALIRRARAGIRVRVMVDALYSEQEVLGRNNPLLRSLDAELAAEVVALSPIGSRHDVDVPKLKKRDHRKLVIIDGERALVSGRNIGDQYYRGFDELPVHDNTAHDRIPWLDAHIEVAGPLVAEVQRSFLATWREQGREQGSKLPADMETLLPALAREPAGESVGRLVVHHGLADANGLAMYEALLDLAEDHVIIANDFPIVSTLERAILRLLSRGV
ncbi:MAG: hypothetical protein KC431_17170, partial [Myxococcales bacterium]|nr:hypothetical protein [Myxococcales bacterium]